MTITNECNMELMARYPDKYFDLAIVDPPYGIMQIGMKITKPTRPNSYKAPSKGLGCKTARRILV
jgi:DNA modification methylase